MAHSSRFVRWFDEIGIDDVPLVGGKNASLGEMFRELRRQGRARCPNGFAITAEAYRHFLREPGSTRGFARLLAGLDTRDLDEPARARPASARRRSSPRRCPRDLRGADRRRLRPLCSGSTEPARRGRAQQRHGRRPARRQLRRPAGDVSQRAGARGAARRVPALLRLAVHRPGHLLPRRQGLRSLRRSRCRSACRRWCAPTWRRPA